MSGVDKPELWVCTECLTVGKKIKVKQGNGIVGASLYLFGVLPGIAYSVWRESTIKHVCPRCVHGSMIPVDTPKGRQLVSDLPELDVVVQEEKQAEANQQVAPSYLNYTYSATGGKK